MGAADAKPADGCCTPFMSAVIVPEAMQLNQQTPWHAHSPSEARHCGALLVIYNLKRGGRILTEWFQKGANGLLYVLRVGTEQLQR